MHPGENKSQRGMGLRQISIRLHGLACEIVRLVENRGVEKVFVHRIEPGRSIGLGKEGVGADVARVHQKNLARSRESTDTRDGTR